MRILGIDPGIADIGFAVIDNPSNGVYLCASWHKEPSGRGKKVTMVEVPGYHIQTTTAISTPARIQQIFDATRRIVDLYNPDAIAVERFMGVMKGRTASVNIASAYGAIICGCGDLVPFEYTPTEVKARITMNGKAEKEEVELSIRSILGLPDAVTISHVSDAFAIAICHGMNPCGTPSARRGVKA